MHEDVKEKIKELVEKYEAVKDSGKIRNYSEEDTKTNFIMPLFHALGWDVFNRNEVTAEEQISGDRVDYGFYINGRIKFYLEAKKLSADLHNEEFARQAIKYAWNKGVTWAILTDFESLAVFNAVSPEKNLHGKKLFEIPYYEYIERFDQLGLLSRASCTTDDIDTYAERIGKKLQRIPLVGDQLFKDLNECRRQLNKAFAVCNDKVNRQLIDEGAQKLLDRLIFIRVAEDRKIESQTLRPLIREWESSSKKDSPFAAMVQKFRELDKIYNSNLFSPHPFETWDEYDGATERVIDILYGNKNYFEYDFSVIPADVLGSVYENYLGYKLQQSKKDLFGQDVELNKDARKRKEQGIYYTPKYIVEYIVKNALGPVLDRCKSISELQKVRVLDPACGSGSFLIEAMNAIVKKYVDFGQKDNSLTRIQVLKQNIYGVDLDAQAVELARLNLLLNTFDSQTKLPNLDSNIKNGNSLISGTDEELKKYFGENYRDKKPFNWEEEYPEVFKQGGFDVVIGNPPWGANIEADSVYFAEKYQNSTKEKKDTYKLFIDKALLLARLNGRVGFIVPNSFLYQPSYEDIKSLISVYKYYVINLGEHLFNNVQLPACILIVEKRNEKDEIVIDLTKIERINLPSRLASIDFEEERSSYRKRSGLFKKTSLNFDQIFELKDAGIQYHRSGAGLSNKGGNDLYERIFCNIHEKKFKENIKTWYGKLVSRYHITETTDELFNLKYKEQLRKKESVSFSREAFEQSEKIIWRQTAPTITAALTYKSDGLGIQFNVPG